MIFGPGSDIAALAIASKHVSYSSLAPGHNTIRNLGCITHSPTHSKVQYQTRRVVKLTSE